MDTQARTTKHTPGPWVVENSRDARTGLRVRAPGAARENAPNPAVCRVYDVLKEKAANARLIAAAPDYHAATEAIRKHLVEGELAGLPDVERIPPELLRALLAAHVKADHELTVRRESRLAITKATGANS